MKIRPLRDQVIVKRNKAAEKIANGLLFAPASTQEKPFEGEVLAIGTGRVLADGKSHAVDVKVGDKILFTKFGLTEVKLEGEEYIILREDAILGVIEQ